MRRHPFLLTATLIAVLTPVAGWAGGLSESQIESMTPSSEAAAVAQSTPNVRDTAVKSAGKATGAAWGYYHEMKKLEAGLKEEAGSLNEIFNFQPYVIKGHILPPVIETGKHAAKFNSKTRATFAARVYRIIHPARIISSTPDWRQWLLPANPKPKPTQKALLPKTSAERAVWRKSVKKGWTYGVNQAKAVEAENLNRLTRTIAGMVMFLRLKAEGMVSGPVIAAGSPVIKVHGKRLSIGTRVFRIDKGAGFSPVGKWKHGGHQKHNGAG